MTTLAQVPPLAAMFAKVHPDRDVWFRHLYDLLTPIDLNGRTTCGAQAMLAMLAMRAGQHRDRARIYFIQMGGNEGPIKIGISVNVAARLSGLQTASPEVLNLLGEFPGGEEAERIMHAWFDHLRIRGEWFRPGKELLAFIMAFHGAAAELSNVKQRLDEDEAAA
jgi:hypothetical protein